MAAGSDGRSCVRNGRVRTLRGEYLESSKG
jgi:hypothetical protein